MSYNEGWRENNMDRHLDDGRAIRDKSSPSTLADARGATWFLRDRLTFIHICSLYLNKVQQAPEAPGNRIEPFRAGIRPLRVNKLSKVPICKVAVPEARWVVLLGDVASGEVAQTQEVAGSLEVTLLLR